MIIKISECSECYKLKDGFFSPCPLYKIKFELSEQEKEYWYHDDSKEQEEAKDLLKQYGNI